MSSFKQEEIRKGRYLAFKMWEDVILTVFSYNLPHYPSAELKERKVSMATQAAKTEAYPFYRCRSCFVSLISLKGSRGHKVTDRSRDGGPRVDLLVGLLVCMCVF